MKLPEKQNKSQADKGSQHIPQHVTARGDNVTVNPPHHKKRPPCHSNFTHTHTHTHTKCCLKNYVNDHIMDISTISEQDIYMQHLEPFRLT